MENHKVLKSLFSVHTNKFRYYWTALAVKWKNSDKKDTRIKIYEMTHLNGRTFFFQWRKSIRMLCWNNLKAIKDGERLSVPLNEENHIYFIIHSSLQFIFVILWWTFWMSIAFYLSMILRLMTSRTIQLFYFWMEILECEFSIWI